MEYSMYEDEEYYEDPPADNYLDMDDLMFQWKQYVNHELQSFKVIREDMFGTGCVCDLKTMFTEKNFEPEFVMNLMPRVKDCASECLYLEYSKLLGAFLSKFMNSNGGIMTIADVGNEEQFFYNTFEKVAKDRIEWNTWDLWRSHSALPRIKDTIM